MEKIRRILKKAVAGIVMTAILLASGGTLEVSYASDFPAINKTDEALTDNVGFYQNGEGDSSSEDDLAEDDLEEDDMPLLGSGSYGKELNRQGYKVQVTSYVGETEAATFKEGILRYQDHYVFCYNPSKSFRETDNVTLHNEVPSEFTEEQGKTISLMIYYIFNNYNVLGEEGAINYYLGQCAIWNYINSINPSFNPYRIYITDSMSVYTREQQEQALNTILAWVDENRDDYDTYIQYWTNDDGDYQPVLYGWAYPVEKKGWIEVQKYSTDELVTADNGNYSFEGAIYGVYATNEDAESDNNRITFITTGQDGKGRSGELSYGTYYVRELASPPSFELDNTIYQVTINASVQSPVVSSAERPLLGRIRLLKVSENDNITGDNTCYSLIGAVYGVYKTRTDAENYNNAADTIVTGLDGIGESGDLPFGTYYVREITPSKGYVNDETIYTAEINSTVRLADITSFEYNKFGQIKVEKASANPDITGNNKNYSLKGAVYGIYYTREDAENDNNRASSITTDDAGKGTSENLLFRSYYVKEVVAAKGFTLDPNIYTVEINDEVQSATVSSLEKPQSDKAPLVVIKKDDEEDDNYKTLYLKDAVFEVRYYAADTEDDISDSTYKRHWYLKTDSTGRAYLMDNYLTSFNGSESDAFYYNEQNEPVFPLGYITVQEVKAPEGYVLDNTVDIRKVRPLMSETERENECTVKNGEKKQSFQLIKLAEDGSSDYKPLANAGFMACKVGDLDLSEDGSYIFDETKAVMLASDKSKEMFTDKDGYALSAELRYGTYLVHETTVPEGYLPVADFLVTISEDSRTPQKLIYKTDMQKKYYLRITKLDSTTNRPVLHNSATYKIWSYKTNDYISFKTYTGSGYEKVNEFKTRADGVLVLPEPVTYGDYRLVEYIAPKGYNIDNPEGIDFSIDDNTIYVTTDNLGDTAAIVDIVYSDTPVTGEISLDKKGEIRKYDETIGEFVTETVPLDNIEFGIYADEDIYAPDGSNTIIYEKGELAYKVITDKDGKAEQKDMPLGKYVIKELNTPDDFIVSEDVKVDLNVDNKKLNADGIYYVEQSVELLNKVYFPKVKTKALDGVTNEHIGEADSHTSVVDKVECSDLVIGRTYEVKGKLYDASTGEIYMDNRGMEVTSGYEFTAEKTSQTVNVEFSFDGENLAGKTVTVFEELYYDGELVASHMDITDTNQQVNYPDVKTTALDSETGLHTGVVDEGVKVVDRVSCSNLIIGKEYTVKGMLYNAETGGAILMEGNEITAEKTFTAVENNMVVEIEFSLNSKILTGETIVCFEDLYINDMKLASHADLEDKNQQVSYPDIATSATDKSTDSKSGVRGDKAVITDKVELKNLVIGEPYNIKGKLYDTETGEPFLDDGKEVTAEMTFIAIKKDMSVNLEFEFNSSSLEGKTTTVFEDLYIVDIKIASHSDISDKNQQVNYPKVRTTARDKNTEGHTGIVSESVTIVDSVECTNLIVGKEYTVKGKLYNSETGEPFLDSGKEVTAEKTFTADEKNMTVELEFTFDSTSLMGETIVVFEDLYHNNIKVDSHARLDDKEQQVHYPKLETTAKNAVDGGKIASPNKKITLNDTVDISNIDVGEELVIRGVIYDKSTGEKLLVDGAEVWGYSEFTSVDKNMKTDVVFTFDASGLAGKSVVLYEYMYISGEEGEEVLVASHEDINYEGQTIIFSDEPKTGDKNFSWIIVSMLLSALGITVLVLRSKKIR